MAKYNLLGFEILGRVCFCFETHRRGYEPINFPYKEIVLSK